MPDKTDIATFGRQGKPVPSQSDHSWNSSVAAAGLVLAALGAVFAFTPSSHLFASEPVGGTEEAAVTPPASEQPANSQPADSGGAPAGNSEKGKELFTTWACGSCHVLADAGATGQVGPSLDGNPNLASDLVVNRITYGQNAMPGYGGQMSEEDIAALTAYIIQAAAM